MSARPLFLAAILLLTACDRRRKEGIEAYRDRMEQAIPQIEDATGLKFKTPPRLELRSRQQVRDFLVAKFDESTPAEQLRGEEEAYKLFGLLPDSMDLRRFLLELLTEQIVGYYDPAQKTLYVVEDAPRDLAGVTVMHELIHALQDQYVNLDSIQKTTGNSDRQAAAQAVLEGQATYEQMSVMVGGDIASRLPGGWESVRETIRQAQSSMPIFASAPMAIQETLLFPYLSGAEFVRRFESRRQGESPLDDLPISTEQVLFESAYFGEERDVPTRVILPGSARAGAGGHEETLGEFGTRLLLYEHLDDRATAVGAARGWDGDRYRVVRAGDGRGILWVTVWDSALDAAQFVDALGQAVGRRYRTAAPTVARNGRRTYDGAGRTVVITPREIDGRNVVMYLDLPSGASTAPFDPSQITLGR